MDTRPAIHISLQSLLIEHTFLVLLFPLLGALFYYSTPCSRRQPIFILNVVLVVVALIVAAFGDAMNVYMLLSRRHMWAEQFQVWLVFAVNFQMILADCILFVRLITVYPRRRVGLVRFVLLATLPVMLKVVRVVNASIFMSTLSRIVSEPKGFVKAEIAWHLLPYQKIEWIAQVVDNSYASLSFLLAIRTSRVNSTPDRSINVTTSRYSSVTKRLRTLFWLALSNFIIPTFTSIAQLVMLFQLGNGAALNLENIPIANAMVAVFGVVFATVWAGEGRRREVKAMMHPPLECEQRRVHPNTTETNLGHDATFTSYKDTSIVNMSDMDEDLVHLPDIALSQRQTDSSTTRLPHVSNTSDPEAAV